MLREAWGLLVLLFLAFVGAVTAYQLEEWLVVGLFMFFVLLSGAYISGKGLLQMLELMAKKRQEGSSRRMRWQLREKMFTFGQLLFLLSLFSLFATAAIRWERDLSEERRYTLSKRTKTLLASIDEDITLLFFTLPTAWSELDQILKLYRDENAYLKYRLVDLTHERAQAERYAIASEETLLLYRDDNPEEVLRIYRNDLYPLGEIPRRLQGTSGIPVERRVDNYEGVINETLITLMRPASKEKPSLYFIESEEIVQRLDSDDDDGLSRLRDHSERLGYRVLTLPLAALTTRVGTSQASKKPRSKNPRQTLVINKQDVLFLFEDQILNLSERTWREWLSPESLWSRHLEKGGGVILVASLSGLASKQAILAERGTRLRAFYKSFGMEAPSGVVVDVQNFHPIIAQRIFNAKGLATAQLPLITYGVAHATTDLLRSEHLTPFLLNPQALRPLLRRDNTWQQAELMRSSARSWLEQDYLGEIQERGHVQYDFLADEEGVHGVAWALSSEKTGAKMFFLGDGRFFENDFIAFFGNRDLILNAILWSGGRENLLGTTYKVREKILFFPSPQASMIFLFAFIIFIPSIWLLLGLVVLYQSKRRRQ